jgi:hypothetical protein
MKSRLQDYAENQCFLNCIAAESLGLTFWIYPYEDHHLLRVNNSVRRATEEEVSMFELLMNLPTTQQFVRDAKKSLIDGGKKNDENAVAQ